MPPNVMLWFFSSLEVSNIACRKTSTFQWSADLQVGNHVACLLSAFIRTYTEATVLADGVFLTDVNYLRLHWGKIGNGALAHLVHYIEINNFTEFLIRYLPIIECSICRLGHWKCRLFYIMSLFCKSHQVDSFTSCINTWMILLFVLYCDKLHKLEPKLQH